MADEQRTLAIRVSMLPRDTNGLGTIFGGVILSYLDQAGAIEARETARRLFVTKAMNEVTFLAPVFVGDTVSFFTSTEHVGNTSITVRVDVEVDRRDSGAIVHVTTASITYVAVDEERKPMPILDSGAGSAGRTS